MSANDNKIFHNPVDAGCFDLKLSQVNKLLPFESILGVVDVAAKIEVFDRVDKLLLTFTEGSGFTISGTNSVGILKSVDLVLNGADFTAWVGQELTFKCTFFVVGDVEIIFKLKIIK